MYRLPINLHPEWAAAVPYNRSQTKLSKQYLIQLISSLLSLPYTMENIEHFKVLYRRLKDVK